MTIFSRWAILFFSFLGIADSAYLADHALSGVLPTCNIGGFDGCSAVAQSAYSHLFGIPLGVYGVGFYTLIFVLAAIALLLSHRHTKITIQVLAVFGVVASLLFMAIQVFIIKAICLYCLASAIIAVLIFIAAFLPSSRLHQKTNMS